MENLNIETRVEKIEGITDKMARVQSNLIVSTNDMAGVIIDLDEMRRQFKQEVAASILGINKDFETKIGAVTATIEGIKEDIKNDNITAIQAAELTKERRRRVIHLLGGLKSDKYKVFNGAYFAESGSDVLYKFKQSESKLLAFTHLKKIQFEEVLSFVRNWNPNEKIRAIVIDKMLIMKDEISDLESQINKGDLQKSTELVKAIELSKKQNIYKSFKILMMNEFGGNN